MKKLILLAAFGFAGAISAKNSEISLFPKKSIEKIEIELQKEKVSNMIIRYGYSYQSTCGWTFSMFTDKSISDMTESEFNDYQLDLIDMNAYVCKLHGEKPTYNFTFNDIISKEIKKEKG